VGDAGELVALVRQQLIAAWPHRFRDEDLRGEVSLGSDGLGLDSIELVELILACEEATGRRTDHSHLKDPPVTIRRLAEHLAGVS
jgi:acyl carrier protein